MFLLGNFLHSTIICVPIADTYTINYPKRPAGLKELDLSEGHRRNGFIIAVPSQFI
jgi:hypothetical protein